MEVCRRRGWGIKASKAESVERGVVLAPVLSAYPPESAS